MCSFHPQVMTNWYSRFWEHTRGPGFKPNNSGLCQVKLLPEEGDPLCQWDELDLGVQKPLLRSGAVCVAVVFISQNKNKIFLWWIIKFLKISTFLKIIIIIIIGVHFLKDAKKATILLFSAEGIWWHRPVCSKLYVAVPPKLLGPWLPCRISYFFFSGGELIWWCFHRN
jgi:hypothetical protein